MAVMSLSDPFPDARLVVETGDRMSNPDPGAMELDPAWQFLDSNSHGHFVNNHASGDDRLPTLTWRSVPCTMGHGDDCEAEGDWLCRTCGEIVTPGTRPARPVLIKGSPTYTMSVRDDSGETVYRFGPEQAAELHARIAGTIADVLAGEVVERTFDNF